MAPLRVGFIGLGKIGFAMARNMIKSGVCGSLPSIHYDLDGVAVERLAVEGSEPASSADGVAEAADVVFSVLPNDQVCTPN